ISGNKPPIANAGPDQIITLPTDSASLDGSSSSDPDGTISEWLWTKISGPAFYNINTASASRTIVKNLLTGAYQFELKVTDNKGLSAKDTVQVVVNDPTQPNSPPVANAGTDQTITLPINSVNLDGSGSTDPDNNISSYTWIMVSGPSSFNIANANAVQTQVNSLVHGVYQFELKVTDNNGLYAKDTVQVNVNSTTLANRPPVANAGADQTITLPANTVNLNGSGSTDPDNNIKSYLWAKISGPSSFNILNTNAVQTQVTNLVQGIYQFELRVTDSAGLFAKDTTQVMVMSQPLACTICKIVFVSTRDGNAEIYSCNVDGSNIQRLTYSDGTDDQPAWSPDGSRIAFISDRTGKSELYTMNADGSNVAQKTFSGIGSYYPTWSPDGTKIAYSTLSNFSLNIWTVGVTGGSPSLLFDAGGWDGYPAWSPDGTKIALVTDWLAYDFVYDIYTINADGTGFTALTGNIFDQFDYLQPSWSPSGAMLAMAISHRIGIDQYNTQVGVMNPDGSGITAIMSGAAPWTRTSWSGDGSKIAYTSLFGTRMDISWVSSDGSASGTIVTDGWNADWQH
ncbi:MAG: PKD domain-containing protein, partial [Chitinophagales bacterium]